MPAPGNGYRPQRRPLEASGRENGRTPRRNANRLHLPSYNEAPGMDQLGKALRLVIGHGMGGEPLPDGTGQVVQAGQRPRLVDGSRHLVCEHGWPFDGPRVSEGDAMTALPSPDKASSFGEFTFPVDSRLGVVRAWELW